jgi:hypothetical protein
MLCNIPDCFEMTLRSLRAAQRPLRLRAFDRRVRKGLAEFAEKN